MMHYQASFLVGAILGVLGTGVARGQAAAPGDSAVLARFGRSNPCPARPPAAWLRPDSLLGRSARCSLVAATAARLAASRDPRFQRAATHAVCVKVHAFTFVAVPAGTQDAGYWTVEFVGATGDAVGAQIDRGSGVLTLRHFSNEFNAPLAQICVADA